ncbi:RHS repeat-associated core domain-containing protein [Paractinoplanes durhamensis]|uniref:RHS repeat-associated core domain-containing protein n=1 Tax=Paractinoplanes durhamensis TaxID=113563 RepID=UPI003645D0FE
MSDPQGTAGCGVAVPHTHHGYDEGLTGLAASFWANGQAAGPVAVHAAGPGGTQPQALCGATSGRLCAHWNAGSPPIGSDAAGQWTLRLTGTIGVASAGTYTFGVSSSQAVTVAVDAVPVAHDGPDVSGFTAGQTRTTTASGGTELAGGLHAVQVDFQGSATQLNEFAVTMAGAVVANAVLDPGYRLETSTTDPDGVVTTTGYSDGTAGPQYGLATSITVGGLTTTTAYEPLGTSTYLRKISRTLPAGNATTYAYYSGTEGPLAAACGVAAGTPQGGQLKSQTDPARVQQFVYDAAGRQVGRRIGSEAWQCTAYDAIGRVTGRSWPATSSASARTSTYTFNVGGNPLVSSVTDTGGTITTQVDLLGRLVSYTDANGQTSTTTYNQSGQVTGTSGPQGTITKTYDPNSGNPATVTADGTLVATSHYDGATEHLTSVTYGNGTNATIGYDGLGTQNSLVFTTGSGTLVAGNKTTLSPARRVTTELEDINGTGLTNPNPAGSTATTYTYDGAGRLVTAYLPSASATYGYAAGSCANANAGANTNRSSVTITPTGGSASSTNYCYNSADQIVSSSTSAGTNSQYAYDAHGNQLNDAGTTLTWDAADRLATTTASGATTGYTYDALDRVIGHATSTTTVHYAFGGYSDAPVAVLSASNAVLQKLVNLPGGVLLTAQAAGNVWSYPDLHGNYTVTTDNAGARQTGPITYDPWGQPTATGSTLANAAGGNTLTTFGSSSKLTDNVTGIAILGARAYQRSEGRFLSVDPIDGGCANNYTYVNGDPFSTNDLTGQKCSGGQIFGITLGIGAAAETGGQIAEGTHKLYKIGTAAARGAAGAAGIIEAGLGLIIGYLIYHLATGCK